MQHVEIYHLTGIGRDPGRLTAKTATVGDLVAQTAAGAVIHRIGFHLTTRRNALAAPTPPAPA